MESKLRGFGSAGHRLHQGKQEVEFYQPSKRRNASVEVAQREEERVPDNTQEGRKIQVLIQILDAPAGTSSPSTPSVT